MQISFRRSPSVKRSSRRNRAGFTLIELLVVMVIIGLLMGLLIPGVQAAREAARKTASQNNLKQIGLAWHNYETARGHYPPSWAARNFVYSSTSFTAVDGWSTHALLLPYLEQKVAFDNIDLNVGYGSTNQVTTADGVTKELGGLRIDTYVSPAEIRDEPRFGSSGTAEHYPLSYAFNLGSWFVWDPATGKGGDGASFPNSRLTAGDFNDGLSSTLCAAEVKGWTPYYRNAAYAHSALTTIPADAAAVAALGTSTGGAFKPDTGHTEWIDGRAHQIGFTTVFTPNSKVIVDVSGVKYDADWTNQQEGKADAPTYAAVTSRSYHRGIVNALMMDGSVRGINDDIQLSVWRAAGTRAGGELLPDSWNN